MRKNIITDTPNEYKKIPVFVEKTFAGICPVVCGFFENEDKRGLLAIWISVSLCVSSSEMPGIRMSWYVVASITWDF